VRAIAISFLGEEYSSWYFGKEASSERSFETCCVLENYTKVNLSL
jgi:hypothetical protein